MSRNANKIVPWSSSGKTAKGKAAGEDYLIPPAKGRKTEVKFYLNVLVFAISRGSAAFGARRVQYYWPVFCIYHWC